jgi:hypothetical protein
MRTGLIVCNEAGTGTECTATPAEPATIYDGCNDLDDNCDGQVDEGFTIMIGDNDGYGYGSGTVPDGSMLPEALFDNRTSAEMSASDGTQYTDAGSYAPDFYFEMTFPSSDQGRIKTAKFMLDVSGIQASLYGASFLGIDSLDYSDKLPQEQDAFGSEVVLFEISKIAVKDGSLPIFFQGGTISGGDAISFDYFGVSLECY